MIQLFTSFVVAVGAAVVADLIHDAIVRRFGGK